MLYLVDIDGTLADLSHRLHFIEKQPADWPSFFAACPDDKPIPEVITTVSMLVEGGARIILVTGRSSACEEATIDWLHKNAVPYLSLYMRKEGDHRHDDVVKAELLDEIRDDWDNEEILGVFEDRKQVVDMYRAKGLRVFQVAEGNF